MGIEMLAAEPQDLAIHQDDFQPQQIVGGQAVFQAMHATRILRHIAADAAGDLTGRVRRVIEASAGSGMADRQIRDTRLHHGTAIIVIDLDNAVEPAKAKQDAVSQRQGTTREGGAGTPRHHLDAFLMAIAQNRRDFSRGLGQDSNHRRLAIGSEPVALIGPQGHRIGDDTGRIDQATQLGQQVRAPLQGRGIRLGHQHGQTFEHSPDRYDIRSRGSSGGSNDSLAVTYAILGRAGKTKPRRQADAVSFWIAIYVRERR